jgi:hypothetical protein
MPPRHPFFIGKNQITFQHTIFLLLHALCIFLGASLLLFSVFFSFVCCNKWLDPNKFLLEDMYSFLVAKNTPFLLLSFNECSLFLLLRLAFIFCLDFCSYLLIPLHKGVFWPLVHVDFHQKSYFKMVRMVLEKRKSFMQKSGTKRSLFRLRLRLLHVVLDVILMVCLVIFFVAWLVSNDLDFLMSFWKKILRCFYYFEALIWFSPWCFIWFDLAHAYNIFDSYKVAISLYDHLVFNFWCHLFLF